MSEDVSQITLAQRFFASNWLLRIWLAAFSLGLPLTVLSALNLPALFEAAWHIWLLLISVSLLFAMAGFLIGLVLFSALVAPLLQLRTRLNGGPFSVGDVVTVLNGKYKGQRGCVCAVGQGISVSLELDNDKNRQFEFGQHQLLRR